MSDGQRCVKSVPSNATLIDVLLDFENSYSLKLLDLSDKDIHPVCQYLNQEASDSQVLTPTCVVNCSIFQFIGVQALSSTTLKALGIQNKALLRYCTRNVSQEEMNIINERVEVNSAKVQKLNETFERKRKENKQGVDSSVNQSVDHNMIESHFSGVASHAPGTLFSANNAFRARPISPNVQSSAVVQSRNAALQFQQQPDFSNFKFPEETKNMDLRQFDSDNEASVVEPCERREAIYHIDDTLNIEQRPSENMNCGAH
uniref:Uncharacterized protein n=1 Tax=Romanomermis culicivorax TaxID=13658 RepID=A0A915JC04_ROMCU